MWTNDRYVRASWVAIFIMMAQVCTGYYALLAYSVDIFKEEFPDDYGIPADLGAQFVALSNLIGSVFSIPLIARVGRRKIILYG